MRLELRTVAGRVDDEGSGAVGAVLTRDGLEPEVVGIERGGGIALEGALPRDPA